jgi:hypothetical protein
MHFRSLSRIVLVAGCLAATSAAATAQPTTRARTRLAAERGSTLVLLVPTNVDTAVDRLVQLHDALDGAEVAAVYAASDAASIRIAKRLQDIFGGSLQSYDRMRMSGAKFAGVLAENAIGANTGRPVVVVIDARLVEPFLRRAMAMAGGPAREVPAHVRAGDAFVLSMEGRQSRISRP